jgi:hypothetical protein
VNPQRHALRLAYLATSLRARPAATRRQRHRHLTRLSAGQPPTGALAQPVRGGAPGPEHGFWCTAPGQPPHGARACCACCRSAVWPITGLRDPHPRRGRHARGGAADRRRRRAAPCAGRLDPASHARGPAAAVRLLGRCDETENSICWHIASCSAWPVRTHRGLRPGGAGGHARGRALPGVRAGRLGLPWIVHSSRWLVRAAARRAGLADRLQRALQSPTERARAGAAGQQAFAQRFTVEACTRS